MSLSGLTASIYSQSTSITALVVNGSGNGRAARSDDNAGTTGGPAIEDAKKQYLNGRKLVEKLENALDRARGERQERSGFRGYDRQARLDQPQENRSGAFQATQAEFSETQISIGPDGISFSQTSLSYSSLAANGGSLTSASLNVTKAYIAFGDQKQTGSSADTEA